MSKPNSEFYYVITCGSVPTILHVEIPSYLVLKKILIVRYCFYDIFKFAYVRTFLLSTHEFNSQIFGWSSLTKIKWHPVIQKA